MQQTKPATQDAIDVHLNLLTYRLNELKGGFESHIKAIITEKANELLEAVLDRISFDEHEHQLLIKAINRTYNSDTGLYHHPLTGVPYDPCDKDMQALIYRWWHGAYDNLPTAADSDISINPLTGEIV